MFWWLEIFNQNHKIYEHNNEIVFIATKTCFLEHERYYFRKFIIIKFYFCFSIVFFFFFYYYYYFLLPFFSLCCSTSRYSRPGREPLQNDVLLQFLSTDENFNSIDLQFLGTSSIAPPREVPPLASERLPVGEPMLLVDIGRINWNRKI